MMEPQEKTADYEAPIPQAVRRFVEYKLYHYRELKAVIAEWQARREDLLHRSKQFDLTAPPPSQLSQASPTENIVMQMLLLETKAQRESFWVWAIEDVLEILPEQERRLVELKYFDRLLTNTGVARELGISERLFYEWKDRILRRFAERFGLI